MKFRVETGYKFSYKLRKNLFCILTVISLTKMGKSFFETCIRQLSGIGKLRLRTRGSAQNTSLCVLIIDKNSCELSYTNGSNERKVFPKTMNEMYR